VATLNSLADRLRFEIGDAGKSFVYQFVADGTTNRFLVPYSPIDGPSLIIQVNGVDVSTTVEVEELSGFITFDTTPAAGHTVVVSGTYYRYFLNHEICGFVETAFGQHIANHADAYGRGYTIRTLPGIEEYPVVVYASTLALYTLATDASFDIDITAPDGVMIPRSERYRQLMQMIEERKNQYKELCSQLGIGLYKIDVLPCVVSLRLPTTMCLSIFHRKWMTKLCHNVHCFLCQAMEAPSPLQMFLHLTLLCTKAIPSKLSWIFHSTLRATALHLKFVCNQEMLLC